MTARRVVLTRPGDANHSLRDLLVALAFDVEIRPLINLSSVEVSQKLKQQAMDFDRYDFAVFVSRSAVDHGMALLDQYWPAWPAGVRWYAVGEGTSDALSRYDVRAEYPEKAGSEGLLALAGLNDVADQRGLIVRGRGGRELLADTLRDRGANIDYLEAYQRTPIRYATWDEHLNPTSGRPIVILTSGEILTNFADQIGSGLAHFALVVPSERIASLAAQLGASSVTISAGASDQALYDAVLNVHRALDGQNPA